MKKDREGLPRKTPDEGVYEPREDRRDIPAERDRLHLHVNSAVLFFQSPVVVQTPKIAVSLAYRKLRAVGLPGMQLTDSRRDGPANHMRGIDPGVVNFEFGVEGNSTWGIPVKLQKDFEGMVLVFEKLRAANLGFIGPPVVVVILQQRQSASQGHAGYEGDAGLVMDLAIGDRNRFTSLFCPLLTYSELPASKQIIELFLARLGQPVNAQERTATKKLSIHTGIRDADVPVERFNSPLLQFLGTATDTKDMQKEEEYARGDATAESDARDHQQSRCRITNPQELD